ncbi:MAG: glutamate-5-semialdehyde dehydrogenase [Ruminococcaceae bacterium]|nr:glutamate-5-semialdehyde dehydrogenase [Oscillospiraceae bacterium]
MTTLDILKQAKAAKSELAKLGSEDKNNALLAMADALRENCAAILEENKKDVEAARGKITDVMIDRLSLDESRIKGMADGIRDVVKLPDPVGRVLSRVELSNGLKKLGLCENFINMVQDTTRQSSTELMTADGYIDLLIPRGGAGLIKACVENATVPVIQTGTGICHIYVDDDADLDMALNIIENAKTSRPSVCNAEEVLLVNSKIADKFLPMLKKRLVDGRKENPVELRLDERAARIIDGIKAGEKDFDTEFLNYILAVGIVDSVEEAVRHIGEHSTQHSDAIITNNDAHAAEFTRDVDSAAVYVNASTRFTDGGCFGLGCEMGISTQKLHARGPMGLCELTTYKYIVKGNGQIR